MFDLEGKGDGVSQGKWLVEYYPVMNIDTCLLAKERLLGNDVCEARH